MEGAILNLRVPGPTPCRREILEAASRQMISHRSPEMRELLRKIEEGLQTFLETTRDFLLLTTSGSGGLEAAVVNTLSPGNRVLGVSAGAFGNRFRSIAEVYGADVEHLDFESFQSDRLGVDDELGPFFPAVEAGRSPSAVRAHAGSPTDFALD